MPLLGCSAHAAAPSLFPERGRPEQPPRSLIGYRSRDSAGRTLAQSPTLRYSCRSLPLTILTDQHSSLHSQPLTQTKSSNLLPCGRLCPSFDPKNLAPPSPLLPPLSVSCQDFQKKALHLSNLPFLQSYQRCPHLHLCPPFSPFLRILPLYLHPPHPSRK